jgi:hypothetical protein
MRMTHLSSSKGGHPALMTQRKDALKKKINSKGISKVCFNVKFRPNQRHPPSSKQKVNEGISEIIVDRPGL